MPHPFDRHGHKVREISFSPAEMADIWRDVMAEAGAKSNEDFAKAFEQALRVRAMRKLALFAGKGFPVRLSTGNSYAMERWLAEQTDEGGLLLELDDE